MSRGHREESSFAQRERLALADLFDAVGPNAPTLCEGWAARDLAAHLVLREGHLAAAGIAVRPLHVWTERAQRKLARNSFTQTVDRFRQGPPLLSAMRLPGAQVTLSTFEHFVHHEDLRRASEPWSPRDLSQRAQLALWQQLSSRVRWYLRSAPVAVRLAAPDFGAIELGSRSAERVTLTGQPAELVLHIHGRRDHAQVEVDGPDGARREWDEHQLRV